MVALCMPEGLCRQYLHCDFIALCLQLGFRVSRDLKLFTAMRVDAAAVLCAAIIALPVVLARVESGSSPVGLQKLLVTDSC